MISQRVQSELENWSQPARMSLSPSLSFSLSLWIPIARVTIEYRNGAIILDSIYSSCNIFLKDHSRYLIGLEDIAIKAWIYNKAIKKDFYLQRQSPLEFSSYEESYVEIPTLYITEIPYGFPCGCLYLTTIFWILNIETIPSSMKALQRYHLIWHRKR